jgi:hypothetical protein
MFRLMRSPWLFTLSAMALSLAWFSHPTAARADYVSQSVTLDQSNALKDGVTYGTVLVEAYNGVGPGGGGLTAGEVRLTYTASTAPYSGESKTFGIGAVGFNTDLSLTPGQISGPGGWKLKNNHTMSGFGNFVWELSGDAKGGSRPNPVTVLISGLGADATIGHFTLGSKGNGKSPPPEGSVYFAMHVAGFTYQCNEDVTSHFVGGGSGDPNLPPPPPPGGSGEVQPTPEHSTIVLLSISFGCLALARFVPRLRKRA